MTVAAVTNRVSYDGDGTSTDFAVSFPFLAKADLVVIETIIATGVQTTKTLTTHYTITGTADSLGHYPNGGTVVANTAPASTVRWTIYRDPALTQSVDLVEGTALPVESSVEVPLDRLTMIAQRVNDRIVRGLRQPEGDSADIDYLPSKVDRASKYLTFDADGDPTAAAAPANTTAVSAFAATILDDTTALAVRQTLLLDKHGTDVASAAAIDLDAATGDLIDVTGTTTITAITLAEGVEKTVRFTGILTLTYGASLILPGERNIATVAGDYAIFRGYASGVVRCVSYVPIAWAPTIEPVTHNSFRLSAITGVPVTTADVTGAGTLYATTKEGNVIYLYVTGRGWVRYTSAEFSLALTATSGKPYDVFAKVSAGIPALETLVWTNDTTRATALAYDSGWLIKSGDATRRYLGTFYASGTNTTEDSFAKRYLWNYYHRVLRPMRNATETTDSWTYTTATFRQANDNAANQLDYIIGAGEVAVRASATSIVKADTASSTHFHVVGIGADSTSVNTANISEVTAVPVADMYSPITAVYHRHPAPGRHTLVWLEYSVAENTSTWAGDGGTVFQAGIVGEMWG